MKKILMSRKWTVTRDRGVSFDDVNLRGRGFYKQQTSALRQQTTATNVLVAGVKK